jgi:ABC-type dipeptide/oligopeptide/nickel transport system ATPase subunit
MRALNRDTLSLLKMIQRDRQLQEKISASAESVRRSLQVAFQHDDGGLNPLVSFNVHLSEVVAIRRIDSTH